MTTPTLGKSLSTQSAASHSTVSSVPIIPSSSFESNRRPSQPGASHSAAPRKGQGQRKQHRNQRKAGERLDDDDMAEMRAVRNASSRRGQTSITHLLNYALPPRPYLDSHQWDGRHSYSRNYRRNPTWGGSSYHAVDKARYVNANYRFIVSPKGDYSKQALTSGADEPLDWADVLQVLVSAESQAASCPICLSDPVAPRMAKCGHIFCLPCLIRFMHTSSSDDVSGPGHEKKVKWRKCPICEDAIYMPEVRPVRFYAGQEMPLPKPGDDVVLRLMMRYASSTLALPKEGGAEVLNAGEEIPWHFAANVRDYARIMRGTTEYVMEQYDGEIEDLEKQEKEDELLFHEDGEWTQKATRTIEAAKDRSKDLGEVDVAVAEAAKATSSKQKNAQPEHDFYFYAAPPHLYLSPLDIRILKSKFGNFSQFPSTLLPRVEHISTGHAVDDALRKRARYLGHLPRGCLISFLECDWTDIVPSDILDTFKDEIERRRKRNRDKEVQEERERLQAERAEAAALRRGSRRNPGYSGDESFTVRYSAEDTAYAPGPGVVNDDDFQPLGAGAGAGAAASASTAAGTTPPNPRPGFAQLASLSTSPSTQRTVWGTPVVQASPAMEPREPETEVDDGWLKDDQLLESFEAADVAAQMEALGIRDSKQEATSSASVSASASANGGGGKKKKKQKPQKITLMSTGGRRGL